MIWRKQAFVSRKFNQTFLLQVGLGVDKMHNIMRSAFDVEITLGCVFFSFYDSIMYKYFEETNTDIIAIG